MKTLKAEAFPVTQHFYVNLAGEYEKGVDHLTNAIAVWTATAVTASVATNFHHQCSRCF